MPPITKGIQNHILVLSKRKKCAAVSMVKMAMAMIAGARFGTYWYSR
jgi:hypothetical protein